MAPKDTKQRILHEALALFARQGYEGTTVKNIADAVGIRDASLYKHYRSKQEIFESLLEEMGRHFGEGVALYNIPEGGGKEVAAQYMANDLAFLQKVCRWNFLFFWKDPFASRYRRMLGIERHRNPRAAEIFRDFFLDTPLRFQADLFTEMIAQGYLRDVDPWLLALDFFAPFWFLIDRYDGQPKGEEEALRRLEAHVELFWNQHTLEGASQ